MESTNNPPELSDSDHEWLHEAIGVKNLLDCSNGWSAADYVRAIERHLDNNPDRRLNAKRPHDGNTPLHLLAISENYTALEGLLMCGADVNALNDLDQTPVTFSQHCPDYAVGFQFFRHLHKLLHIRQPVNEENARWFRDARDNYDRRYPRDGYVTAFTHNPRASRDAILDIRAGGEEFVRRGYDEELANARSANVNKKRTLHEIVDVYDDDDGVGVPENRMRELRKYMKCRYFFVKFPDFGFAFKQKYRRTLESLGERRREDDSTGSSSGESMDYAKRLREESERSTEEFLAREDSHMARLMRESGVDGRIDRRGAACGSFERDDREATVEKEPAEPGLEDKVERMRRLMARLPRSVAQS